MSVVHMGLQFFDGIGREGEGSEGLGKCKDQLINYRAMLLLK